MRECITLELRLMMKGQEKAVALEKGFQKKKKKKHLVLHSLEAGRLRRRRVSHLHETLN